MKDPERLLSSNATDFERTVLRAARLEQPSAYHVRRMRRALVLAEFAFLATGFKAAASVAKHSLSVALVGTVLAGSGSSPAPLSPPAPAQTAVVVAARESPSRIEPTQAPREARLPEPPSAREPLSASESVTPKSPSRSVPTSKSVDLREEIRLLDLARAQLRSGSAAEALGTIASYRSLFPRGAFLQEATVLRIDALAANGNLAKATAEARRFVSRYPSSPHAERLQHLSEVRTSASKP